MLSRNAIPRCWLVQKALAGSLRPITLSQDHLPCLGSTAAFSLHGLFVYWPRLSLHCSLARGRYGSLDLRQTTRRPIVKTRTGVGCRTPEPASFALVGLGLLGPGSVGAGRLKGGCKAKRQHYLVYPRYSKSSDVTTGACERLGSVMRFPRFFVFQGVGRPATNGG